MKIKSAAFVLLFTTSIQLAFSQNKNLVALLDKAFDFANCKAIEVSLNKDCNCDEYPDTEKIKDAIGKNNPKTLSLFIEIARKKDKFKNQNLSNQTLLTIPDSLFSNASKKGILKEFVDKRDPKIISKLKSDITGGLRKMLQAQVNDQASSETLQPADSLKMKLDELTITVKKLSSTILVYNYVSYILILIIMTTIVLSIVKKKRNKLKKKQTYPDNNIQHVPTEEKVNLLQSQVEGQEKRIRVLTEELENNNNLCELLREKFNQHLEQNTLNEKNIQIDIVSNLASTPNKDSGKSKNSEVFYLSWPNKDGGNFDSASATTSYKEGATIFKFHKLGSEKSEFEIDDSPETIQRAFQYPDLIEIVCEPINGFNHTTNKITTTTKGTAELQGKKWVVIKKAKIRYES